MPRDIISRSPCSYGARRDAVFPFKLDELYPSLKPGTYTLSLAFNPRNKSFPPTLLTTVTFSVADKTPEPQQTRY